MLVEIIDKLIASHRQVVVAADVGPGRLAGFSKALRSRLTSGSTVILEKPDRNHRLRILQAAARRCEVVLDYTTARFIAKQAKSDVRSLLEALTRIRVYARFKQQPISKRLAKKVLRDG